MAGIILMKSGVISVIYNVLIPKFFPKIITPKASKGNEIETDMMSTGSPRIVENTMDSPVIPPGAKPVNWKKKFTATAVNNDDTVIQP